MCFPCCCTNELVKKCNPRNEPESAVCRRAAIDAFRTRTVHSVRQRLQAITPPKAQLDRLASQTRYAHCQQEKRPLRICPPSTEQAATASQLTRQHGVGRASSPQCHLVLLVIDTNQPRNPAGTGSRLHYGISAGSSNLPSASIVSGPKVDDTAVQGRGTS